MKSKLSLIFMVLFLIVGFGSGTTVLANTWSSGTANYDNGTLTLKDGTYTVTAPITSSENTTWSGLNVTGAVTTLVLDNSNIVFNSTEYTANAQPTVSTSPYAVTALDPYLGYYVAYAGLIVDNDLTIECTGDCSIYSEGNNNVTPIIVYAQNGNASLTTSGDLSITAPTEQQTYYAFKDDINNPKNSDVAIGVQSTAEGTASLTLGAGASVTGLPAVIVGGETNEATATITDCKLQSPSGLDIKNNSQAVLRNYYIADKYDAQSTITVNDSTIDGGTSSPGIYATNSNGTINLNDTDVSGYSGIVSRGSAINITGGSVTGVGTENNETQPLYSDIGSGAAITVPASAQSYGKTVLKVSGSTLSSTNNAAITTQTKSGSYVGLSNTSSITNTKLEGTKTPSVTDTTGTDIPIFGSGTSSNQKLNYNNLQSKNTYQVTSSDGKQYTYFSNQNSAQSYSQETGGTLNTVNSDNTESSPIAPPSITGLKLTSSVLDFYNSGSAQSLSIGYTPTPNNITPNRYTWTITGSSNYSESFGSFVLNEETNTYSATADGGKWTLSFKSGSLNVNLIYSGSDLDGRYTLTGSSGNLKASCVINVSKENIGISITPSPINLNVGESVQATATVTGLEEGQTVTFSYAVTTPNVVRVGVPDYTSGNFTVTGIGVGSTYITVTAKVSGTQTVITKNVIAIVLGNSGIPGGGITPPPSNPNPPGDDNPSQPEQPGEPEQPENPTPPQKPSDGFTWWVPGAEDDSNTIPPDTEMVTIYRLYNTVSGEYLYTPFQAEVSYLTGLGDWRSEGIAWEAPTNGVPVYRLYNPLLGTHLYTTDTNEVSVLQTQGWVIDNDGIPIFYSGGMIPVYRLYNPSSYQHLLTADENEYNILSANGWNAEGIAFYAESK